MYKGKILVESEPLKVLMISLGLSPPSVLICCSKAALLNMLGEKCRDCIGIMEEDPWGIKPVYGELSLCEIYGKYGVRVYRNYSLNNYLVVICPSLGEWLTNASLEVGVSLAELGLSTAWRKIYEVARVNKSKYESLVRELDKRGSLRLNVLRHLLLELMK